MSLKPDQKIAVACIGVVLVGTYVLAGLTGISALVIMGLLFVLPTYLFLSAFKLDMLEKLFFSFFLGIGMYSVIAYLISFLVPSLRISTVITFVAMLGVGYGMKRKARI